MLSSGSSSGDSSGSQSLCFRQMIVSHLDLIAIKHVGGPRHEPVGQRLFDVKLVFAVVIR